MPYPQSSLSNDLAAPAAAHHAKLATDYAQLAGASAATAAMVLRDFKI
jgi:hypothetical protein